MSELTIKSTDRAALAAAGEALAAECAPLRLAWREVSYDAAGMYRGVSATDGLVPAAIWEGHGHFQVIYEWLSIMELPSLLAAQHAAEAYAMAVVREQAAALGMAAVALPALAESQDVRLCESGGVVFRAREGDREVDIEIECDDARAIAGELWTCAAEAERRAAGEAGA
jgi:hypothetical protein